MLRQLRLNFSVYASLVGRGGTANLVRKNRKTIEIKHKITRGTQKIEINRSKATVKI